MRKVINLETGLIEIIKYGTKIFTEPDINKRGCQSSNYYIYVSALDNILSAMKGRRIFERFGFNAKKEETPMMTSSKLITTFKEWEFNPKIADWKNIVTDETLTNYKPKPQLITILKIVLI